MGTVSIIHYNHNADSIVSAAGRISTTQGSADEIYQKSVDREKESNVKLIHKILSSGHESVIEHINLNLSFDDVSVFVEQFMIEFRLASFTVKSRRYVDFGAMGYYAPDFSGYDGEKAEYIQDKYHKHMQYLFDEYNYFIQAGIPKEDARFVLPYSFKSNFYCTLNARELIKIMNEMVYGRGKDYPELVKLGESLFAQCEEQLPFIAVKKSRGADSDIKDYLARNIHNQAETEADEEPLVTLVNGPANPEEMICQAAVLNYGCLKGKRLEEIQFSDDQQRHIIKELLRQPRKRELEQVNFTIGFHNVSLAGITHLVRHRMQSIIIPEYISSCRFTQYVVPDSIVKAGLKERYREVFTRSGQVDEELRTAGIYQYDRVYLLLSGLGILVMTTMNAHELVTFMSLRTCNRAQWEIKEYGDELLRILRKKHPALFSLFGPTCFMTGKCSEGKMTCGKMQEVYKSYSAEEC